MSPSFKRHPEPRPEAKKSAQRGSDFTLGELLSKRREELEISLKEAEKATKIRSVYLEQIESAAYDKLPDNIYTKGYVKNYADFLGFETKPLLSLYAKERQAFGKQRAGGGKAVPPSLGLKPLDNPSFVITPRSLFAFLGVILVGLIVGYIAWQLSILSAPPKLTVDTANNTTVSTNIIYFTGHTDESADLFINDTQVATEADGSFREKVTLVNGSNQVKITARSRLNKSTTVSRTIIARLPDQPTTKSPASTGTNTSAVSGGVQLVARIGTEAATVKVVVDGKEAFNGTMTAGSEQTFRGNETITFSTSNAQTTSLVLSNTVVTNKDLGKLGTTAEPKNDLVFNKDTKVE